MGVVQNIVAGVIIIIILLSSGLLFMTFFTRDSVHAVNVKTEAYLKDVWIGNLNAVLKVMEPDTGRTIGILLADALYYRTDTLDIGNITVNVTNRTAELLNMSFGGQEYYLVITPRIVEVSLNFIIDGSPSLEEERQFLANHLQNIITTVEKKLNDTNTADNSVTSTVIANIYILHTKQDQCEKFNDLADGRIRCYLLGHDDLYKENTTSNSSEIFINNTRFDLEAFHDFYNMTPPFGYTWLNESHSHYAPESAYAESDWGYGMGYASNFDAKTSLSRLTLLFPMGDELSTSSIADSCFYENDIEEWTVCGLCSDVCPVDRSMKSVAKGVLIAQDNLHVINPIFSYSCDYEYKSIFNDRYEHVTGNPTSMACSEAGCGGCSTVGTNTCFHPTCSNDILSQMTWAADQTGGSVINLMDIDNLDINITKTINENIEQFTQHIGEKMPYRQRHVIETSQPLPNGELVDITLWIYTNDAD